MFLDPKIITNSAIKLVYGEIRMSNFKTLSIFSGFWTPIMLPKMASGLFYGEIC
jgi:hypothetical protein